MFLRINHDSDNGNNDGYSDGDCDDDNNDIDGIDSIYGVDAVDAVVGVDAVDTSAPKLRILHNTVPVFVQLVCR